MTTGMRKKVGNQLSICPPQILILNGKTVPTEATVFMTKKNWGVSDQV